jgi:uncharacterized membrane protein YqjE
MSIKKTLAGAAGDIVAMVRTRIELFGLELNVETSRLFGLLSLACVALLCAVLSVAVFSFLIVAYFWDTPQRLIVIGLLGLVYGVLGAGLLARLCQQLKSASKPFEATLQELNRDIQMLAILKQSAMSHEEPPRHEAVVPDADDRNRL